MWKAGLAIAALPFLLAAIVAGCGGHERPLLVDHPGYPIYRKYCRRCHGAEGDGAKASRVAQRPVDLGSPAYRDTVDLAAVRRVVMNGKGKMGSYSEKLAPRDVEAVSEYVLGLAGARGVGVGR